MRDYLYIWNEPKKNFIVASGIHFRDVATMLIPRRGIVLLKHAFPHAANDPTIGFDFVPAEQIAWLAQDDIYAYGDFCWVDFAGKKLPAVGKKFVAELLYFAHTGEPYGKTAFADLDNRFMFYGHDDGWYLKLYYQDWRHISKILAEILEFHKVENRKQVLLQIQEGKEAFWIARKTVNTCEKTHDIDGIVGSMRQ